MAIRPARNRQPRERLPAPRPAYASKYHGARMSAEEYLRLPEEKPYLEYADGMVIQKPMPNEEHSEIVGELQYHLVLYRKAHGGKTGPERRVGVGPNFRLPDTGYWSPTKPGGDDALPTLAVEVLSPTQDRSELREKCRLYRRAGVDVCWLIDPATRTAEVFEGNDDGRVISAGGKLESPALPGFSLELGALFSVLEA